MIADTKDVASPCIGICSMDQVSGLCLGCYRTIDEIRAWRDMPDVDKRQLLELVQERQLQGINFDE